MNLRQLDLDPQTLAKLPLLRSRGGRVFLDRYERLDRAIVGFLREHSVTVLRVAVAVVFIWFGVLKVIDRSPVADLVADTVPLVPDGFVVPALGIFEIAVGLGLLLGVGLRIVLLLLLGQMAGTFLVLLSHPGDSFQDSNPLLLTVLGEFVVKNIVFIAAALVVGSMVRQEKEAIP